MKKQFVKMSVLLGFGLAVLAVAPAFAESNQIMRVEIPFAFLAGDQMHPAGNYVVRVDSDFRLVELRDVSGVKAQRVVLSKGLAAKPDQSLLGSLSFNQYGETYVLSGVWGAGANQGYTVKPSKAEAELARTHGGASGETSLHTLR